jgi:hypothetical protein
LDRVVVDDDDGDGDDVAMVPSTEYNNHNDWYTSTTLEIEWYD